MTTQPSRYLVVAGNIGVGKSSLTRLLAQRLGWEPFFEAVDDNPYLSDFYSNMQRWSFHSQIFFLSRRVKHHHTIAQADTSVVQDRSIYEDAEIFARNLYSQGHMSDRDWLTYRDMYELMIDMLPTPDLVIYLKASVETLTTRIRKRGRDFEQDIDPAYLHQLNGLYARWVEEFTAAPILCVPADSVDFVAYSTHLELIVAKVRAMLSGMHDVYFSEDEIYPIIK